LSKKMYVGRTQKRERAGLTPEEGQEQRDQKKQLTEGMEWI